MRIKLVVIDLQLTHRQKWLAGASAFAAICMIANASVAEVPNPFTIGQTLTAEALNENFADLDARITALRANGKGVLVTQTASVSTTGDGVWVDVPGLVANELNVTEQTTIDVFARVDVTATNLASPGNPATAHCALRLVLDDAPVGSGADAQVNSPFSAPPFHAPMIGLERLELPPGAHTIKVQISKPSGAYAGMGCVAGGATFNPHGQLRVVAFTDATVGL